MRAERSWRCPGCGLATSSSRAVRARYCARCGVWCSQVGEDINDEPGRVDITGPGMPGQAVKFTGTSYATVVKQPAVVFELEGVFEGFNGTPGKS